MEVLYLLGLIGFDSKMKWNVSMSGYGDVARYQRCFTL